MMQKYVRPRFGRMLLLALAIGAVATPLLLTSRSAEAIIAILIGLRSGPVGLTRGTEGTFGVYLPTSRSVRTPLPVVNTITDGTSNTIFARENLTLVPGGPCGWVHVKVFENGSVQLNGRALGITVPEDGRLQLVSQVTTQAPKGTTLVGSVQVSELATNRVLALLPYIEQDN